MKKAIREWAFNLFTKRVTIKVSELPDNEKIDFLANRLMNELVAQGNDISGSGSSEYVTLFAINSKFIVTSNEGTDLKFKRLTKV